MQWFHGIIKRISKRRKLMEEEIVIIRSNRKTLALEITSFGEVRVRAPWRISEDDIFRFIEAKTSWIEKHLKKVNEDKAILESAGTFSEEEMRKLKNLAKQIISEKVAYYARIMDVTYGNISIRRQKTRWGSCSREGNLSFNVLLMMAPPEVLDYVVVHELSHRIEMNHSPRFWRRVEEVLPDYKKERKWLKEHGNKLMLRM